MPSRDEMTPVGRSSHAMASLVDQVLVIGGRDNTGNILRDMWVMDVQSGSWKQLEASYVNCYSVK